MEMMARLRIRLMSYRRRHQGASTLEAFQYNRLLKLITLLVAVYNILPGGHTKDTIFYIFVLLVAPLTLLARAAWEPVQPIDAANKNRGIDSFSNEECWTYLRFRKSDIWRLFELCGFPNEILCSNGLRCSGQYAFCLMLYRLAYPTRLHTLQSTFGRDHSQISRIFNAAIDFMYQHHRQKVQGNLDWYADRFDLYNAAILKKILNMGANPYAGYVPNELVDIFAFLDGTGLEIARLYGGVNLQNPFWNGYMHGHYIIFQGISFPDGMTVIEGPEPGYYTDTMVWRDCEIRHTLRNIMQDRQAAGQRWLKLYADKIYSTNDLITAAYSLRDNRLGLQQWMKTNNRIMSAIRVAVEWSFGKIVGQSKFVTFGRAMTLQRCPVSKLYHVAVLLANAHTCMYGGQHLSYFGVVPPTVEEYFSQ
jgi:nuclease HARBI1